MESLQLIRVESAEALKNISADDVVDDTLLDCRCFLPKENCKELASQLCVLDATKQFYIVVKDKPMFYELFGRLKENPKLVQKLLIAEASSSYEELLVLAKLLKSAYKMNERIPEIIQIHPLFRWKLKEKIKKTDINFTAKSSPRQSRRSMYLQIKKFNDEAKEGMSGSSSEPELVSWIKCYVCGLTCRMEKRLCHPCFDLNYKMLTARTHLQNRYAIVTGGRIKIGFHVALRLLRDGCNVIVTTRFPHSARSVYTQLHDYAEWKDRVQFRKLDLLNMLSVQEFILWVQTTLPHLDILVNNAAQTIWRPSKYFEDLQKQELRFEKSLAATDVVQINNITCEPSPKKRKIECGNNIVKTQGITPALNSYRVNELFPNPTHNDAIFFPEGHVTDDGQQLDLRPINSWKLNLTDIPFSELLQVLTVNAVAPFILISQLKSMLVKSPFQRKFVVNVSAMEGQFSRFTKGQHHPHTNMAKAALNMLTRTSGLEFKHDNIYMTAVDTGWCTDERPHQQAQYEKEKGFIIPLTEEDGAARVYHPIIHGMDKKNLPYFAVFLKNYKLHPW